ncbi:MAG: hypothetical protein ACRC1R_01770 [Cetobacterium sp.]|uniref:hypothetical protein n=1 Tax=Cetobacterium sp. TaxID=2071632 RepID=UPI003F37E499
MNRVIVLLLSILFFSCSNLNMKKEEKIENPEYQILYENWQLDQLRTKIDLDTAKYGENKTIIFYERQLRIREQEKQDLLNLLDKIKIQFALNDLSALDNVLDIPLKGRYIKKELQNIDLSQIKLSYTIPTFFKNNAKNIIGFRYEEEIIYFQVEYKLINNQWKIINFEERR